MRILVKMIFYKALILEQMNIFVNLSILKIYYKYYQNIEILIVYFLILPFQSKIINIKIQINNLKYWFSKNINLKKFQYDIKTIFLSK